MLQKSSSSIDRKTASKLLKVSVRTIDRYIRRGRLSVQEHNGRIWLNKKEILAFPKEEKPRRSLPRDIQVIDARVDTDTHFYRDLYDDARRAVQEYQQKLEHAHYRIGQLESQIVHPLSGISSERREQNSFSAEFLRKDLVDREKEIALLKEYIKREKNARVIFAILTYVLLAALPALWYFLR